MNEKMKEMYDRWADIAYHELLEYGLGLGDIELFTDIWPFFEANMDAREILIACQWCVCCLAVHENAGAECCDECAPDFYGEDD